MTLKEFQEHYMSALLATKHNLTRQTVSVRVMDGPNAGRWCEFTDQILGTMPNGCVRPVILDGMPCYIVRVFSGYYLTHRHQGPSI
jgi:hypothetical protein